MKLIKILTITFLMCFSFSFAQENTASAVTNKNNMFAESYGTSNYASSIIFKKKNRDAVTEILNKYFENSAVVKNKIIWRKLIGISNPDDSFFIELKQNSLKIEWKNKNNNTNKELIDKLKIISKEILNQ